MYCYSGILIRRARLERGIPLQTLAQQMGVSAPALAQWEGGYRPLPPERAPAAAAALGVPLAELQLALEIEGKGRRPRLRPPFPIGATVESVAAMGPRQWELHTRVQETLPPDQYRLLRDEFPRQTRHELLVAMLLSASNARLALSTAGFYQLPLHTMHDLDGTVGDHLLQPAIIWETGGEQLVAFGQPWINVPRFKEVRPDFLIRYMKNARPYWLALEIDDKSSHEGKKYRENERALKFTVPILRYENSTVEKPWFFNKLLEDIRNLKPEVARRRRQQRQRARAYQIARERDAERRRSVA